MGHQPQQIYEFGPYRLDAAERLLMRDGDVVPLQPKVFDLLLALVERHGRLLEKDELMRVVWPDAIVEEANLANNISILRKTISVNGCQFIETAPKRGYRFIADVRKIEDESEEPVTSAQAMPTSDRHEPAAPEPDSARRSSWRTSLTSWRLFAAAIGVLLVAIAIVYTWRGSGRSAEITSLAVLPFKSLQASDEDTKALGLGLANTLITKLSNIDQLTVPSTNAVRNYNSQEQDPLSAGRRLGVGAVLDGNFQRDGERIRVTVRLWRVSDGATLWAEKFDQKFGVDLFAMQDAIAERVVAVLPLKLSSQEQQILTRRHTESIEAYQLCNVGWYHWYKYNQEGWRKSCEYFERAISLDPNYALAYTGLSMAWGALGVNLVLRPKDAFPRADAAALKAIALDDTLGEAHLALGAVKLYYHWDWPAAQREFGRALELNPRQAYVHRIYGVGYLRVMGRLEEALAENQRAQALEPFSPLMNQGVGRAYYWLRRYDEAIAQLLKTLEMDPNLSFSQRFLADAYEQSGRYQEAIAAQQKALTSEGNAELAATMGQIYATAGYHQAIRVVSEKMLGQLHARAKQKYVAPTSFAVLYIRLGDKDQAFAWLDKAVEERDGALLHLKVDPSCDSLRSDPRYASLLRRIGLEP